MACNDNNQFKYEDKNNSHITEFVAKTVKIGSRESELALRQTHLVRDMLKSMHPNITFEIVTMTTKGDKILNVALSKIGSKSLFTKELEDALMSHQVDLVVHSLKDLPTCLPEGLVIGAVGRREDARDAVVMGHRHQNDSLMTLPHNSVVGTSSLRRIAQLKRHCPHLRFESIRGNLNTRLRKLDETGSSYSAIVLAVAGMVRMGWKDRISQTLEEDMCMYAVGQGALAIECREGDIETLKLVAQLAHLETTLSAACERAFMATLEGGCSAPVAVSLKIDEKNITLKGGVWSLDGNEELLECGSVSRDKIDGNERNKHGRMIQWCGLAEVAGHEGEMSAAAQLGVDVAQSLLTKGAKQILKQAKAANVIESPNVAPVKSMVHSVQN